MRLFSFSLLLSAVLFASLNACARTKKTVFSSSAPFTILDATEQRTNPGRQEMKPFTTFRFHIIWKDKTNPSTFFWRPDAAGWMETTVAKPIKRPGMNPGDFMIIERHIDYPAIRAGDTLIITTTRHSHDEEPMPSAVKKMPEKALYYQTAAGGIKWFYMPVTPRKQG